MKFFSKLPLAYKLPAIIVVLGLIAAGATAAMVVFGTRAQIHDMAEARVAANRDTHKGDALAIIATGEQYLKGESKNPLIESALRDLSSAYRGLPGDPAAYLRGAYRGGVASAVVPAGSPEAAVRYDAAHARISGYLQEIQKTRHSLINILLIDPQGNVVYNNSKEDDYATNVVSGPLAETGLGQVFKAARNGGDKVYFTDLAPYEPSGGIPARFAATAVSDKAGQVVGVLVIQAAAALNTLMQENLQLGETGISYLVGEDLMLRTSIPGEDAKAIVNGKDSPGVRAALAGQSGVEWIRDDTGTEVLAAYAPIEFGGIKWALVSQQNAAEIYAPVDRLVHQVLLQLLVAAAIICAIGALVARSITRPLTRIGAAMTEVAHANYGIEIPAIGRGDEIGSIANSLAGFRDDLVSRQVLIGEQAALIAAISATQAMIEFDPKGKVLNANQNFLHTMGYSESEIVGRPHANFCEPEFAASNEYGRMWTGLGNGEPLSGTLKRLAKGGRVVYLMGSYTPILGSDGKIAKVLKMAFEVTAAEIARLAGIEARAVSAAEQLHVVEQLSGSLGMLADGDLTIRIDEAFAAEYEVLRGNFNDAIEKLEVALSSVKSTAENILNEAAQVSQAADDLSHRTENQAASLEETAAALEELTSSVKTAAKSAEKASGDVGTTRQNAEESGRIVREAVNAMSEIEKSSGQISQIIGVIDDIAFQTNLLALNAGVEAARAGEAGRGFAVVASEVRALAQRSSDAAKEIKALISTSSQQVGHGVHLVRETGKSLETIVEAVGGIAALVGEIANSAREQSVGLTEINTAVTQLDQVTQQNAAMVEESTAASHAMKAEAESLASLVAQFNARAAEPATPARAAKAPAKTAPRTAGKPVARIPAKPGVRAMPVPRTNGSAALAIEPRDPIEDWKEF